MRRLHWSQPAEGLIGFTMAVMRPATVSLQQVPMLTLVMLRRLKRPLTNVLLSIMRPPKRASARLRRSRNGSCTVTNMFTVGRPNVMNWRTSGEFAPLMLVVSGSEKYKLVATLFQAAEMLTVGWPIDDGEEYLIAIRACRNAIHGEIPAQDARAALIRAADEAGIPVITVH